MNGLGCAVKDFYCICKPKAKPAKVEVEAEEEEEAPGHPIIALPEKVVPCAGPGSSARCNALPGSVCPLLPASPPPEAPLPLYFALHLSCRT